MSYYAVDMTGMLDLRNVRGPFSDLVEAKAAADRLNKASCKGWFVAQEPLYVSVNDGYVNGPFRSKSKLRKDMKAASEDTTIGGGRPSFAGIVVEMVVGLHQCFAEHDTVTAVIKQVPPE